MGNLTKGRRSSDLHKQNKEVLAVLEKTLLFKGLPPPQLEGIASIGLIQRLPKGRNLFCEGDRASGFYVILTGRIKVYKLSLEGKEQVLHIFNPGEVVGEVPVFSGGRYPAHAETMERTSVLFFPRDMFINLIKSDAALALNMLAILSKRLRHFTRLVEDLSLKEVPGRLAAYLLMLCDSQGNAPNVELDISKGQLASVLGTIPETLSRILGRMSQKGMIQVQGRMITIVQRDSLELLAEGEKLM